MTDTEQMIISEKKGADDVQSQQTIEIPDGGYGWVVLFAFFLYNFCTWGANAGYAIYLAEYMTHDRFEGGGKLDYAAVGGIAFGVGFLVSPFISYAASRLGIHAVIACGILLQTAGLLLAAFSKKLWQLYLTQGVLLSLGMGSICIATMGLIPQWFRKRRTMAAGVGASGSGLGGIIFNLAMQKVIEVKSVRWALIIQCIMCTVLALIALLLTRTRVKHIHKDGLPSKAISQVIKDYVRILHSTGTFLLCCWASFSILGYVIVLYSLSAFTQNIGYNAKEGSYVSCMVSVGNLFGRPLLGMLADVIGPITVAALANLVCAILCWAMWIPTRSLAVAIVYALFVGALMGVLWVTLPSITTRVVGLKNIERTFTLIWICVALFGVPSPVIGLQLRSNVVGSASNYVNTAIFTGFMFFAAAFSVWLLRAYILARDLESMKHHGALEKMDHDELHITVKFSDVFKAIFTRNPTGRLL